VNGEQQKKITEDRHKKHRHTNTHQHRQTPADGRTDKANMQMK